MTTHRHDRPVTGALELLAHLTTGHLDGLDADDVYAAAREGAGAVQVLHQGLHPETWPPTVRFDWWLHYDEVSGLYEHLTQSQGVAPGLAKEIAEARPFYEVKLEVQYNTATKEFVIVAMRL